MNHQPGSSGEILPSTESEHQTAQGPNTPGRQAGPLIFCLGRAGSCVPASICQEFTVADALGVSLASPMKTQPQSVESIESIVGRRLFLRRARSSGRSGPVRLAVVVVALLISTSACSGASELASGLTGGNADGDGQQLEAASTTTTTEPQLITVGADAADQAEAAEQQIAALVASMTVEQKVGQLLMPVLFGTTGAASSAGAARQNATFAGIENPVDIVRQYHLGGVLYQEENVESAEQLRALSKDLRAAAAADGLGFLIAVDQEGGKVSRVSDQVSEYPSPAALAGDIDAVREAAYVTGQQVQQQGVNVVLAPVADVLMPGGTGFLGQRSYGDDPDVVASMVTASITGLQRAGVAAAAKHWPGHGGTIDDSHEELPSISITREQWETRDRIPFDAAIAEGVEIVMVGHLAMPNLDSSGDPATVSPVLIDGLLRQELGFDGVVMTDALNMAGVGSFDSGELAVGAVNAGADILLQPADLVDAAEGLRSAVVSGELPEDRLDASVTRVLRLKQRLGLLQPQ